MSIESIDDMSIVLVAEAAAAVPVDDMAMVMDEAMSMDEAIVDMAMPDIEPLMSILSDRRSGIRVSRGAPPEVVDGERERAKVKTEVGSSEPE
ncbi:hypothetical protein SLS58_001861 [Diplodia intermedia]|uniref:Uncharacterized protein n=1 Tax=Diplodia intermedia TaxID=856260 RepID=A0ABR3U169_9PEZI